MKNIILKWITTPKKQKKAYLKIVLCCNVVSICLLTPYANAALSATTVGEIHGTQPYLSFDNGATPELTTEKLLTITVGDQDYTAANAGTFDAPIQLPTGVTTVDQVQSYVTKTVGTTAMSADIINIAEKNNLGYDSDGDKIISGEGTVSIDWKDFRGQPVSSSSAPLNPCFGPYQLTVLTSGATLNTQYGLPPDSKIEAPTNNSVTYYIAPPEPEIKTCYVAPTSTSPNVAGKGWNTTYQWFDAQNATKFPTTGFDKATFIIRVVGSKNTPTLTVPPTNTNISGKIEKEPKSTLHPGNNAKITLTGLIYSTGSKKLVLVPATFVVTLDTTNVYTFSIKKWFLPAPKKNLTDLGTADVNCRGLAGMEYPSYYNIPERKDMTTATVNKNSTTREIGAAAVAEWGNLGEYKLSSWTDQYYWAGWTNDFPFPKSQSVGAKTGYYTTENSNFNSQNWTCIIK